MRDSFGLFCFNSLLPIGNMLEQSIMRDSFGLFACTLLLYSILFDDDDDDHENDDKRPERKGP